jgi:hypothetical protein
MAQRLHNGVQIGLAGQAAHGRRRGIHHAGPRFGRLEDGRRLHARGVVGVEVDRNPDLLAQGLDQLVGRVGLAQAGHVLDGQDVRARLLQLLGQLDVIGQRVLVALRVQQVAGVADRRLADRARLQHRIHGRTQVGQPVQAVEHAEHVNTVLRRALDEPLHDIVRVVGVANSIAGAQQHLEKKVRNRLPQLIQPDERILAQEAHGGVKGRPTPHLEAEQLGRRWARNGATRIMSYVRTRVASSDWWASRMVVSVSSSALLLEQPGRKLRRPQLLQFLAQCPAAASATARPAEPARQQHAHRPAP